MRLATFVLVLGIATPMLANADPIAELYVHVKHTVQRDEMAIAVVDSIFALDTGSRRLQPALNASCEGIHDHNDWSLRVKTGDSLVFALVKQGGLRLAIPEKGLDIPCHCQCSKPNKSAQLHALFVTPSGLQSKLKSHGMFVKSWPKAIHVKVGWGDDLAEGPAEHPGPWAIRGRP
jgi:hypothetical protein